MVHFECVVQSDDSSIATYELKLQLIAVTFTDVLLIRRSFIFLVLPILLYATPLTAPYSDRTIL